MYLAASCQQTCGSYVCNSQLARRGHPSFINTIRFRTSEQDLGCKLVCVKLLKSGVLIKGYLLYFAVWQYKYAEKIPRGMSEDFTWSASISQFKESGWFSASFCPPSLFTLMYFIHQTTVRVKYIFEPFRFLFLTLNSGCRVNLRSFLYFL